MPRDNHSLARHLLVKARVPYEYKREPLTQHEATQLANACVAHTERLVVWTLLDTGLRVSELTGLRREHVDWQQHRLIIFGKGGTRGPRSKRRVVPLSPRVQSLLEPHFSLNEHFGIGARTVQRMVKRVANRATLLRPVSPHVLRHTFAVTAVQKGISLPTLQRLLGHEHLSTTQIYLNLSPEEVIGEFRRKW
jgi:integrase/recombinase XerD